MSHLFNPVSAGSFGTARRGALSPYEIALAHQWRSRGRGVQSIAKMLGRPQGDVGRLFADRPGADAAPKPPSRSHEYHRLERGLGLDGRESRVFAALLQSKGIVDRSSLMDALDGATFNLTDAVLQHVISRIRAKLAPYGIEPMNVRKRGYYLTDEAKITAQAMLAAEASRSQRSAA